MKREAIINRKSWVEKMRLQKKNLKNSQTLYISSLSLYSYHPYQNGMKREKEEIPNPTSNYSKFQIQSISHPIIIAPLQPLNN